MISADSLPALKEIYAEGRLLPFVGAGVSTSVVWRDGEQEKRGPTWRQLVSEACRRLGFDNPDLLRVRGTELQILEYFKIKRNNQFSELRNWLAREMYPPDSALIESPIHNSLKGLNKCKIFYTTNFDDFLERAFGLLDRPSIAVALEAHMAEALKTSTSTEIVKFHGDLNNPDFMVLSESDYEQRLNLSEVMDYRLQSDMLGRAVLFIGYSFRDWNVSYLFRILNDQLSIARSNPVGPRGYITVPDPSDFEVELFKARNIHVIPIRGEHLTADTAALLTAIAQ